MNFMYVPPNDLDHIHFAQLIPNKITEILFKHNIDFNEYLELFEINKYFQDRTTIEDWDTDFKKNVKNYERQINKLLGQYFNQLEPMQLIEEIKQINYQNTKVFLQLFDKYKMQKKVNTTQFQLLLESLPTNSLTHILSFSSLVNTYSSVITRKLVSNPKNAELIIRSITDTNIQRKLYLPEGFAPKLRDSLFEEYINLETPNINYLRLIYKGRFQPEVDALIKLKAKNKYDSLISTYSNTYKSGIIKFGFNIKVEWLDTEEFFLYNVLEDGIISVTLNSSWLNESLDYSSILQNLIYVFEIVDSQFKFSAIPNNEEESVFERVIGMRDTSAYSLADTTVFKQNEMMYIGLITTYIKFLEEKGINFENIIDWFFSKYLPKEFNIKIPNLENSFYDKNIKMHLQFHRILKQYHLYTKYGDIDPELVKNIPVPSINSLSSLSSNKYAYINNEGFKNKINTLFSDQTMFGYSEKYDSPLSTRLLNGIHESDFQTHDSTVLENLIFEEILKNKDEFITYSSYDIFYLLKTVFDTGNLNCYWLSTSLRDTMKKFFSPEDIAYYNQLFSKEEADYLNYYLNDYFSNGRSLRNKYTHGSMEDVHEEKQKDNYYTLIYLFLLLVIKINEELDYQEKSTSF